MQSRAQGETQRRHQYMEAHPSGPARAFSLPAGPLSRGCRRSAHPALRRRRNRDRPTPGTAARPSPEQGVSPAKHRDAPSPQSGCQGLSTRQDRHLRTRGAGSPAGEAATWCGPPPRAGLQYRRRAARPAYRATFDERRKPSSATPWPEAGTRPQQIPQKGGHRPRPNAIAAYMKRRAHPEQAC